MRLFRLIKIFTVVTRFGLDEYLPKGFARSIFGGIFFFRSFSEPRAVRLRLALESLGPTFIKFGQILSTRPDLVPADISQELAHLQDNVPPFASDAVVATLNRVYGRPYTEVFSAFDLKPIASASIAQVHFAVIAEGKLAGREVAVKILRPDILNAINGDVHFTSLERYCLELVLVLYLGLEFF